MMRFIEGETYRDGALWKASVDHSGDDQHREKKKENGGGENTETGSEAGREGAFDDFPIAEGEAI